ncbi:MAG: hypothetical protein ACWGO1_12795 [Anaerolineales bacterium]
MDASKIIIILAHPFVGWAFCTASMVIGMATELLESAFIVHVVSAPIVFAIVSLVCFNKFSYTTPLLTGRKSGQ